MKGTPPVSMNQGFRSIRSLEDTALDDLVEGKGGKAGYGTLVRKLNAFVFHSR